MSTSSFRFTKPVRHENLEIHFLRGPSGPPDYLTLAEGCGQQVVEIFETGRVGRLSVINKSADRPLFIQLGELLKGGLQDRTVATDLVSVKKITKEHKKPQIKSEFRTPQSEQSISVRSLL